MTPRTDSFDLGGLRLTFGEGRRLDLRVSIDPLELGGEEYRAGDGTISVRLEISRISGGGYALRLRFETTLQGPCMRCLEDAAMEVEVDAREVSQPGEGEELESPYVEGEVLDLRAWARDALVLALPPRLLCRPECAGLCPICGANLNLAGLEHHHEAPADHRWDKLSELRFE